MWDQEWGVGKGAGLGVQGGGKGQSYSLANVCLRLFPPSISVFTAADDL